MTTLQQQQQNRYEGEVMDLYLHERKAAEARRDYRYHHAICMWTNTVCLVLVCLRQLIKRLLLVPSEKTELEQARGQYLVTPKP